MYGLIGSHRTGKTTLARAYAEKHGIAFVETSVSAIFRDLGYDPAAKFDFKTRLKIQEEILERVDQLYGSLPANQEAITDRTPLDMLAYTMAEAIGDTVKPADQKRFAEYANRCFDVANRRFSTLVLVQPGIPLVKTKGKAAMNVAYMEHLNSLMLGISVDERVKAAHFYILRRLTSLDDRMMALESAIGQSVAMATKQLAHYASVGGSLH